MSTYVTHTTDADSTREFGARLAPLLQAGDSSYHDFLSGRRSKGSYFGKPCHR